MRAALTWGLVCLFMSSNGQTNFEAIPKSKLDQYHLNFGNLISSNDQAHLLSDSLNKMLKQFRSRQGSVKNAPENLLVALTQYDQILILYNRLWMYYNLHVSIDRTHTESRIRENELNSTMSDHTDWFAPELAALPQQLLVTFTKERPKLRAYHYYLRAQQRVKSHVSTKELLPLNVEKLYDRYDSILKKVKFEDVESGRLKLNSAKDRTLIESSPDSAVRSKGFKKLYAGYRQSGSLIASVLIDLAKLENEIAKAHKFSGAAEAYYFEKFHTTESISLLFKQIVDSVPIYHHYQTLRRRYLQSKIAPSGEVHLWDMKFSTTGSVPRYAIDSATAIILAGVRPLGNNFQKEFADLLNPANGRMEIAASMNKRAGGFSRGFIGTKSIFYSGNYQGFYNDIRIIAHEATHAVHREIMSQNHVLPVYASGANYFFESFAMFSEFLLSDYLVDNAPSIEWKKFYLEKYFEGKGMALFSITTDAMLEEEIHNGVANGTITDENGLNKISENVNKKFSIWSTSEYPQQNLRWITNTLFYEDPFYNVNYVLGVVLALKYYELYQKDKTRFSKNYQALLKNGFTDAPTPLLKKFLNIDLDDPTLLNGAFRILRSKVAELEKLYERGSTLGKVK